MTTSLTQKRRPLKAEARKTAMKTMTTRDFDRLLAGIIDNDVSFLLSNPGVYQILSEYYNHDVLAAWETQQAAETARIGATAESIGRVA